MPKRPTTKALLERIAALEAKVKELEARPQIVIQQAPGVAPERNWWPTTTPYIPSPSVPWDHFRPYCGQQPVSGAISGHFDGTARWELRQAHISGN